MNNKALKHFFSIILPVYNVKDYLHECLNSILNSELRNMEIIAINDGSTDDSLNILQSYTDTRLKIYSKKNEGLYRTWRYGVSLATGDYIIFVDSDDFIDAQMFARANEILDIYSYDLIQFGWKELRPNGKITLMNNCAFQYGEYMNSNLDDIKKSLQTIEGIRNFAGYRWAKVYRTELLKETLQYTIDDIVMFEDNAIVYPYIWRAKSIYLDAGSYYYYRIQRKGSICSSKNREIQYLNDCKKINNFFCNNKRSLGFTNEFLDAYYFISYKTVIIYLIKAKLYNYVKQILQDKRFKSLLKAAKKSTKNIKEHIYLVLLNFRLIKLIRILLQINSKLHT